jgi:hypothetical protein
MFGRVRCGVPIALMATLLPQPGWAQSAPPAPAVIQTEDGGLALKYFTGGETITVVLPRTIEKVTRVLLRPTGRIVVIGGDSITVVAGTSVVTHLHCYWPSVSADGRHVAFRKFYARDTPEQFRSEVYQVLDTDSGRELTIYPLNAGRHHISMSALQWVDDPILAFLDYDGEDARVVAVVVQDGAIVKTADKVLDASRFVDPLSGPRPGLRFAEPEITRLPSESGGLTLRLTFPTRPELKVRRMDIVLW